MDNVFNLKHSADVLGENAKNENEKLVKMTMDTTLSLDQINKQEEVVATANKRFEIAKDAYEKADAKAKASLGDAKENSLNDPKMKAINGYADTLRGVMKGNTVSEAEFKNATGANVNGTDDANGGDNFLPITLGSEIISEPDTPNPLHDAATFSSLVNLRLPKADIDFGDAWAVVNDGAEANDAELKGDHIEFGRNLSKIRVGMTDTLLAGTSLALVQWAQQKLINGSSALELARAFADKPMAGEEHMSFYDPTNKIKVMNDGADLYEKITGALADLSDADADQASIFMTRTDFNKIVKLLSNSSATLFGAAPETIFGVPVHFTSRAVKPVIGNFSQYQGNYDPMGSMMEQYRDPKTGVTYVQYTLWYDAQIKRPSAFRIIGETEASK